jgi:hypothetical protein
MVSYLLFELEKGGGRFAADLLQSTRGMIRRKARKTAALRAHPTTSTRDFAVDLLQIQQTQTEGTIMGCARQKQINILGRLRRLVLLCSVRPALY